MLEEESGPHLVTFGLGGDGHIASVFPEWYQSEPERWAQAIQKSFGRRLANYMIIMIMMFIFASNIVLV